MGPEPAPLTKLVERLRQALPSLHAVWCFGSVASGTANAESDLDLAVLTGERPDAVALFDLAQELAVLASRDVDLIDLRSASTVLRFEIISTGKVCWEDGSDQGERFADDAYSMYVHFNEERASLLADIRARGTIGA